MTTRTRCLTALLLVLPTVSVAAPKFDSRYTRFGQDCKELPQSAEAEGQDPVLDCPGPAGLHARIQFSAADASVIVVKPVTGKPDEVLDSLIEGVLGVDAAKGTLEWRLADGAPFAIIVRSRPMVFDDNGAATPGPLETLEVKAIGAQPAFAHSVETRHTAKANEQARELADQSWASTPR